MEGAKSLIVFDASGQALTLVFKILAEDLKFLDSKFWSPSASKNEEILKKNDTILSKKAKCLAHEVFPTGHPCKY